MKGTKKVDVRRGKKTYLKPEVKSVQLRPEEAVLGGCKVFSASGPTQASCTTPVACNVAGTS
jgi:hypothetical protein